MKISDLSPDRPFSCAQGRYGEVLVAQEGSSPIRWLPGDQAYRAGMDAPSSPPAVLVDSSTNYHIARIDVASPGALYYAPPTVTLSGGEHDETKGRQCKAKAYLSQASVNEILVEDGGKYFSKVPNVVLGDSHGSGAKIVASTGVALSDGITQWEVTSDSGDQADLDDNEKTRYALPGWTIAIPITGNGSFKITVREAQDLVLGDNPGLANHFFLTRETDTEAFIGGACLDRASKYLAAGYDQYIRYTVSGFTGTSRVLLSLKGDGHKSWGGCGVPGGGNYATRGSETATGMRSIEAGSGFDPDQSVTISFDSIFGIQTPLVIEGYPAGHPLNSATTGRPIRSISVEAAGEKYIIAPQLQIVSSTGFGAYATCTVKDGAIDKVTLENPGGGYKSDPEVRILSGGAEASVVARPHMRGLYQCYYRYIDGTPEASGGPIPSNLSAVAEVDAGEGATSFTWTVAPPSGRAKKVELWRSTGNQALTVYRVATLDALDPVVDDYGVGEESLLPLNFLDDLTDEELRDPDRDGYEAMPIVLPNGELNANRFVPPPSKSVVVRFQDRYWYGVGGANQNAIYFSEIDEPESVPVENEIIPQQSGKGSDVLTAMVPYGSTLLLMQSRHTYGLTFSRQPLLDAQVSPLSYRGCVSQRTWDIHDGILYVMDQGGIYATSQSGNVQSISDAIEGQFRDDINWGASRWFFLVVDPKTKVLRAFVSHKDDGDASWPTRALCYSIDSKGWWVEVYPQRITGASQASMSNGDYRCVYAAQGGAVMIDEGSTDLARGSVTSVLLTNPGRGYKTPPTCTATGGSGARFQATLDDTGRVSAIWILSCGTNYSGGDLIISPPDDTSHADRRQATATYSATSTEEDAPVSPLCVYKSGLSEYPTDDDDYRLGSSQDRSVSLTYEPHSRSNELSVRMYYNGSKQPRPNVVSRDRGTGFRQDTIDPAARLDIGSSGSKDSGVVKAGFSGLSIGDMRGTDRHVAAEIVGSPRPDEPLILYKLDLYGADK